VYLPKITSASGNERNLHGPRIVEFKNP